MDFKIYFAKNKELWYEKDYFLGTKSNTPQIFRLYIMPYMLLTYEFQGLRGSTGLKVLPLHAADDGSFFGITYSLLSTTMSISTASSL